MTYNETMAIVYRVIGAYPFYSRNLTDEAIEDMIREWHQGLMNISSDGVMEAVTELISENKWMPTLSEVIGKVLDIQYGTEADIIKNLDRVISHSSNCIIFGQVTEEQKNAYEDLPPFMKLIIHSPYEFNLWLNRDYEWKEERVKRIKREVGMGKHTAFLNSGMKPQVGFDIFKALEERKNGKDQ